MSVSKTLTTVVALLASTLIAANVPAKAQSRTVRASVVHASGSGVGIHAERLPGRFTVPKGHVAVDFKYHFHDPSENYTSTRLGPTQIFSVTLGRSVREAEGNANLTLPPGKYKFVVGGRPGAYGSLSFRLTATDLQSQTNQQDTPGRPNSGTLKLPRNFDVSYSILDDVYVIEDGVRTRLREQEGVETIQFPATVVFQFRDGKVTSRFTARLTQSAPALADYHMIDTTVGNLSEGQFTGTTTNESRFTHKHEGHSTPYRSGTTWSLTGQVESDGLLVLHTKWLRDFGTAIHVEPGPNGTYRLGSKPFSSGLNTGQLQTEIHLRLPVGTSRTTHTLTEDLNLPTSERTVGPQKRPPEREQTFVDTPRDSIWGDDSRDTRSEDTTQPPIARDDSQQQDDGDIWTVDEDTDENTDDQIVDNDLPDDGPQNADSRDDDRRIELDNIAEIQRRSDEKEKQRSRRLFQQLADAKKKAKEHGDRAKRHGDMATMYKADALGFDALTRKDKQRLGKADDDIKDHLRGKPTTVRSYQRGIIDDTMSQDMIDATHTGLKGTKMGIDASIGYLESATGTPGKIVGKTYTILSKVAEKVSKANADYHAGTTDSLDYDSAVSGGIIDGVTDIIVDEVSGAVTSGGKDKVTKSRAGQQARDSIKNKLPE